MAQSSKGAFQLAYYAEALKAEYENLTTILIIHKTDNEDAEKACMAALTRLGITCLIYNPTIAWPNRVINLSLNAKI